MTNHPQKVLIVGGVAGGASAAARLRRLDEQAHIVLFERGPYISFANCGLPYHISETIQDRGKLLVQTPEAMTQRFNLDIRIESEVVAIDPERKMVTVNSRERGQYEESYDQLLLSPGAKPIRPALPGMDHERVFTLRSIPDMDRIKEQIQAHRPQHATIIGGGFIGVEMAENLREIGLDVALIEAGPHILAPFDADVSVWIEHELQQKGVHLLAEHRLTAIAEQADKLQLSFEHPNQPLETDFVILAIGVQPDTAFLADSGIERTDRGHIIVDEQCRTNVADIYAVGDAIQVADKVNGHATAVPLAGPANKQGRIAADQIAGLSTTYTGTQGTAIIKVFDLTAACTGMNEKALKQQNIPYQKVIVHPLSHAGYYPGASAMTLKILFDEQGKLLGGQAVGKDGVDKRIDVLATAIHFKGSINDLTELELSYAPPYSSAKDPVNMAGYAAENIRTGKTRVFAVEDLSTRDEQSVLLDVRTKKEFEQGHIPGSVHIPVDELRDRINELPTETEIWVYCQVGIRGYTASRILEQHGYETRNLTGGYKSYAAMNR
ncbi:FAD-dependent oxidoreductase [Marinicrinis sediminis]|uniref:FAD-dependent oxidoreductase n=1 Tax=Marinicrinis sediminis TaxID=1652465 RepID=A0ABW5RF34_9BACL